MIASAAVHTVGVNWTSVLTIVGSLSAVLLGLAGYIGTRVDKHREATSKQITDVALAMGRRLDKMEECLRELARQDTNQRERLARLEAVN